MIAVTNMRLADCGGVAVWYWPSDYGDDEPSVSCRFFVRQQSETCGCQGTVAKSGGDPERARGASSSGGSSHDPAPYSYPHMCRDGHDQIGHGDSEHGCPLCMAQAQLEYMGDRLGLEIKENEQMRAALVRIRDFPFTDETSRYALMSIAGAALEPVA